MRPVESADTIKMRGPHDVSKTSGYVTSLPTKLDDKPVEDRLASEAGWLGPREKEGSGGP